jgi:hypothetical protein
LPLEYGDFRITDIEFPLSKFKMALLFTGIAWKIPKQFPYMMPSALSIVEG